MEDIDKAWMQVSMCEEANNFPYPALGVRQGRPNSRLG